ncbi:MAG: 3-deoxy-7-phosphoheptulonate synthase [Bacteroidia bacterium]|nr:MAG: 3-deoxy-7-phosphoheptulonate synthase [Bacteroidia bacterium]
MEQTPTWLDDFGQKPLIIAGPCSAETREQVLATAQKLSNSKVSIFRAGIWKPRTRPGSFEGVGEIGLKWLQEAKEMTGLPIAVEVASPAHVRLASDYGADVLWIGARTTVNPFAVQEIADSLKNTDKIVLIKNPINPDLSLWIGALERFTAAGVEKIGVIHRGFSIYKKIKFRNEPQWEIPVDFQQRYPHIPLLCDPSHIGGNRSFIADISQTALNLNFDGLMIETHPYPEAAWSDSEQQITPENLLQIIDNLKLRKETLTEENYLHSLSNLRVEIDQIDAQLMELFGKRMQFSDKIGTLKKEKNVAVLQTERWQEILQKIIPEGEKHGLSRKFILKMFNAVHQESIRHQNKIMQT